MDEYKCITDSVLTISGVCSAWSLVGIDNHNVINPCVSTDDSLDPFNIVPSDWVMHSFERLLMTKVIFILFQESFCLVVSKYIHYLSQEVGVHEVDVLWAECLNDF